MTVFVLSDDDLRAFKVDTLPGDRVGHVARAASQILGRPVSLRLTCNLDALDESVPLVRIRDLMWDSIAGHHRLFVVEAATTQPR